MNVFAISDLHLSSACNKPMDIFAGWENHIERIASDWNERVTHDDVVLLGGDLSWAMTLENAMDDLKFIGALRGKKIIIRGNHDYWWKSLSALRAVLPSGMYALQNDCVRIGELVVCGTRGWNVPEGKFNTADDKKLFLRETERLKLSLAALNTIRRQTDTVVAMMHYPPFNARFEATEMTHLYAQNDVKTIIYGHLHGKNVRTKPVVSIDGSDYVLTSCDQVNHTLVKIAQI